MLKRMRPGSAIVDISVDQGGCFETTRPTTHEDPTYIEEGIVHYCVANIPGAYPRTSTLALTNATFPYVLQIADKGYEKALEENEALRKGLNRDRRECGLSRELLKRSVWCANTIRSLPVLDNSLLM